MSRWIALKSQSVEVFAPRDLVFEVVASAGKKIGETADGKLVEFETKWRNRVIKTVEAVSLEAPTRIRYRWVEGRLDDVEEEITFSARSAHVTTMSYSGRLGSGGRIGWLRTAFIVRPIFNRLVREHLEEGKRIAETRAKRSRIHPKPSPTTER